MRITDLYFSRWLRPGMRRTLTVGGLTRTYIVHEPKGHDLSSPLPLVVALHGATMNGPMMAWFSGLNQKADEAGFIAVYPDGTGTRSSYTWNAGTCCGSALQNQVNDVSFIDAVLDELIMTYSIDVRRIYATGVSNGGMMAYRLAAELPDRIASITCIAGSLVTEIGLLKRAVSVLHLHGTSDEFVPFTGGKGERSLSGTNFRSVEDTILAWVDVNGCDKIPVIDVLSQPDDEMKVIRRTYRNGRGGSEVVLVEIEGGGHTWPGRKTPALSPLGKSALSISANDLMWEFFQKHQLA